MNYEAKIKELEQKIAILEGEIQELPDKVIDKFVRGCALAFQQNGMLAGKVIQRQ